MNYLFFNQSISITKSFFCIAFTTFILCCSLSAMAQSLDKSRSFGIGLETGVSPNVASNQWFNVALTARYSIHAGPGFVSLGTGLIVSRGLWKFQIPVKAGYKFIFSKQFFVMSEFGYYMYRINDDGYTKQLSATSGLSVAPSVGVQFGVFETALFSYLIVSNGNLSTIGLRIGWDF